MHLNAVFSILDDDERMNKRTERTRRSTKYVDKREMTSQNKDYEVRKMTHISASAPFDHIDHSSIINLSNCAVTHQHMFAPRVSHVYRACQQRVINGDKKTLFNCIPVFVLLGTPDVARGKPRDGATAWVQSSAASAHRMHIHIFNKVAVRKTMNAKNTAKQSPIH